MNLIKFQNAVYARIPQPIAPFARRIYERVLMREIQIRDVLTFAEYAKSSADAKWHKVYDRMPNNPPPPTFHGSLRAKIAERNVVSEFPEAGVLEIKMPYLRGSDLISRNGYVLTAIGRQSTEADTKVVELYRNRISFPITKTTKVYRFNARGVVLMLNASFHHSQHSQYGHFVLDVLSRLQLFQKAGFKFYDVDYIIGPPRLTNPKKILLEKAAVPLAKYVPSTEFNRVKIETVLAPSFPGAPRNSPSWSPQFFRSALLPSPLPTPRRRLYLCRKGFGRNAVNEAAVLDILSRHDFEIISPVEMDAEVLFNKFVEASIVVSAHGTGLANIGFCQPGTKILELIPTDHVQPYFYTLASAAGLKYNGLVCRSTDYRGDDAWGPSPYNFYVNESELEQALTSLLT